MTGNSYTVSHSYSLSFSQDYVPPCSSVERYSKVTVGFVI